MQFYPANADLPLTLSVGQLTGLDITPDSINWRVLDASETPLSSFAPIAGYAGADQFALTVPASLNQLPQGVLRDARVLQLSIHDADGNAFPARLVYGVQGDFKLEFMVNSYQTLAQAELAASALTGLSAWGSATEDQKAQAMIDAYNRIGKLSFNVKLNRSTTTAFMENEGFLVDNTHYLPPTYLLTYWRTENLNEVPATTVSTLPKAFLAALGRAQVLEADSLMSAASGSTEARRNGGVTSETVGESSVRFRDGKPLSMIVSNAALRALGGFVRTPNGNLKLVRA